MNFIRFFLSIIVFSCLIAGCSKTQYGIITAKSGLILRQYPTVGSIRMDIIPQGAKVVVISTDGPRELLYKIPANWYKISYNSMEGWAFGGFIKLLRSDLLNAYKAETEDFIEFYEYMNKDFDMIVNLCQGVGEISGDCSYKDEFIHCKVKKINFSGFLGDNITGFRFKFTDNKNIIYDGSEIGCGPHKDLKLFKFDK